MTRPEHYHRAIARAQAAEARAISAESAALRAHELLTKRRDVLRLELLAATGASSEARHLIADEPGEIVALCGNVDHYWVALLERASDLLAAMHPDCDGDAVVAAASKLAFAVQVLDGGTPPVAAIVEDKPPVLRDPAVVAERKRLRDFVDGGLRVAASRLCPVDLNFVTHLLNILLDFIDSGDAVQPAGEVH